MTAMQLTLLGLWIGTIGAGAMIALSRDRSPGLAALLCALFGAVGVAMVTVWLRRRSPGVPMPLGPAPHFVTANTDVGTLALEEEIPAPW